MKIERLLTISNIWVDRIIKSGLFTNTKADPNI